ncbi:MAG TPA: hypothetical protein VM283_02820 [Armatimonadota bacterium]|nr:hypothetical protein [Armatimonadota bacterium]
MISRARPVGGARPLLYGICLLAAACALPAGADRVLVLRGVASRVNNHWAGEVWAGSEVVVRLRSSSESGAAGRAQEVVARLTQLALSGLRPGDFSVAAQAGTFSVTAGRQVVVTADADTIAASGLSAPNLCESWRKRLATAFGEPYLVADRSDALLVPWGESRTVRYGTTIKGQVQVASMAEEIAPIASSTPGKVIVRGASVGTTTVAVSVGEVHHAVVIEVKKWAARIPAATLARVRGPVLDTEMGLAAVTNAALGSALREPGATVQLLDLDREGAGYKARLSAHGPGYIPLTREVVVGIVGGLTPMPQAARLLVSNYPEKVGGPQTLMRQQLRPATPTRVYWHHVNAWVQPLSFAVRVLNAGDQEALVRAGWAQSGPGTDEVFVGFSAMLRFWEAAGQEQVVQLRVPPGSVCQTASLLAGPGRIVSGIMEMIADAGDGLYAEVLARTSDVAAGQIEVAPQMAEGGPQLSTYDFDANLTMSLQYAVGGPFAHATVGRDAVINDEGFRLEGAYGVMHSIVIETSNPTDREAKVEVVVRAGGGVGRVVTRIDGELHYTRMLGAGQEEVLTSRWLAPGEQRTMRMQLMPTAGSNLPNTVIVRSLVSR